MTKEKRQEFLNKFTYLAGDGERLDTKPITVEKVLSWIDTNFIEISKSQIHKGTDAKSESGLKNTGELDF